MSNVVELGLLTAFFVVCLGGLLGFVSLRQPVHAALSFALCVLSGAGFYLILSAPYIAAATVIVYAGATIIIFLFALMFAQQSVLQAYDLHLNNHVIAIPACLLLLGILCWSTLSSGEFAKSAESASAVTTTEAKAVATETSLSTVNVPQDSASVSSLGAIMFTRYLWAIELAGTLLLVAAIGAICISSGNASDTQTALGTRS